MFDMALLRCVPNMKILAPSNEAELAHALHTALKLDGPVALRYPRGEAPGVPMPDDALMMKPGKSREVRGGTQAAILAFGRMVNYAVDAAELLAKVWQRPWRSWAPPQKLRFWACLTALLLRVKWISYLLIWALMPKALLIPLRICLVNRLSYTGISR